MDGDTVARASRTVLRYPREADRTAFSELVTANREFLARGAPVGAAEKDPDGFHWFDATLTANAGGASCKFLVVRTEDAALLGMLSFRQIERGSIQSANLSYWIGAVFARQGLMTEALDIGLAYAFGPLELHRVEADIQPDNAPSIALVRRAGFSTEEVSQRWALTREAWDERNRTP